MTEELLISQDYVLVSCIYLAASTAGLGLAWYLLRALPWAEVRQLLLAVLAALLLTPIPVESPVHTLAPALITGVFQLFLEDLPTAMPAFVRVGLSAVALLIVVLSFQVILRMRRSRQSG